MKTKKFELRATDLYPNTYLLFTIYVGIKSFPVGCQGNTDILLKIDHGIRHLQCNTSSPTNRISITQSFIDSLFSLLKYFVYIYKIRPNARPSGAVYLNDATLCYNSSSELLPKSQDISLLQIWHRRRQNWSESKSGTKVKPSFQTTACGCFHLASSPCIWSFALFKARAPLKVDLFVWGCFSIYFCIYRDHPVLGGKATVGFLSNPRRFLGMGANTSWGLIEDKDG